MGNGESLLHLCTVPDEISGYDYDKVYGWDQRSPVTTKHIRDGVEPTLGIAWSTSEMQGWRESMEDAHLALTSLGRAVASSDPDAKVDKAWTGVGLFGVMDGHGGFQVAKFCERHLPASIASRPCSDPASAMSAAFEEMDELLQESDGQEELRQLGLTRFNFIDAMRLRTTADGMGCTAVLSCITAQAIIVANAGDSRAVLCRNGQAVDLSQDHKPSLPSERKRIEQAGGWIEPEQEVPGAICRVNGDLSLSRAIGDLEYKRNGRLPPESQIVTAVPEIQRVARTPQDEFLLLACDGIWDVVSSRAAVDFLRGKLGSRESWAKRLATGELLPSAVLSELLDYCLSPHLETTEGYGGDNMTAVLVLFLPLTNVGVYSPQMPRGLPQMAQSPQRVSGRPLPPPPPPAANW